jgi:hypothetical protein
MSIAALFEGTVWSLFEFAIGFLVGGTLDWMFFKIYSYIDYENKNPQRLIVLSLIQLVVLIFMVQLSFSLHWPSSGRKTNGGYFVRWGLIMSQFFLLQLGLDQFSEGIYHRSEAKGAVKKSMRANRDRNIFEADANHQ